MPGSHERTSPTLPQTPRVSLSSIEPINMENEDASIADKGNNILPQTSRI
ncbi:hypothetical protein LguiB_001986 [Lonicera macranthoides]